MARWNRVNAYRRFEGIYRFHVQELMNSRRKGSLEDEGDTLRISTSLTRLDNPEHQNPQKNLVLLSSISHNFPVLKKSYCGSSVASFIRMAAAEKKNLILFEHASLSVVNVLFGDYTSYHW
jgi:hypothetical protein